MYMDRFMEQVLMILRPTPISMDLVKVIIHMLWIGNQIVFHTMLMVTFLVKVTVIHYSTIIRCLYQSTQQLEETGLEILIPKQFFLNIIQSITSEYMKKYFNLTTKLRILMIFKNEPYNKYIINKYLFLCINFNK